MNRTVKSIHCSMIPENLYAQKFHSTASLPPRKIKLHHTISCATKMSGTLIQVMNTDYDCD